MMQEPVTSSRSIWAQRAFGVLLIGLAALVLQCFALIVMPSPRGPFGVATMVSGEAPAPYSSRVLMPIVVRGLEAGLPPVKTKVKAIVGTPWTQEGNVTFNRIRSLLVGHIGAKSDDDSVHIVFWSIVAVLCFATFGVFLWRSFVGSGMGETMGWIMATGLMLLTVPLLARPPLQMYDPMTLALGAALAFFGLKKSWLPFFLLLPLAGISKEALLILVVLPILSGWEDRSWKLIALSVAGAVVAYLISRQVISSTGAMSGSQGFQMMFSENLALFKGQNLSALLLSLVAVAPVVAIVATAWRSMSVQSRRQLAVCALVMLPPLVAFGRLVEARILYDILPLTLMLCVPKSWLIKPESAHFSPLG